MKKMTHYFTQIAQNVAYLTMSVVVSIVILLGIPLQTQPYIPLGYYRITRTPTGFSLYQPGGNYRYYTIETPNSTPVDIRSQLLIETLKARFFHSLTPTTASAFIVKDTVIISANKQSDRIEIRFNRDDIVFDKNGILYTEHDENTISTAQSVLNNFLKNGESSKRDVIIPERALFIINPNIPGVLLISSKDGLVTIHKNAKTIEVNHTSTTIQSLLSTDDISEHI